MSVLGGSHGLVVKGVDLKSEGYEFESWRRILDGHFFVLICLKRQKRNEKEAVFGPFFKLLNECSNPQVKILYHVQLGQ